MSTLYERLMELCEQKGVSGSRMCLDLGMSKSTMSGLKAGRVKGVSAATAQKFASYLGVTVGYLLGSEEKEKSSPTEPELSEGEKALIELFRHIPEEQQKVFLEMGRVYADSLKKDRT